MSIHEWRNKHTGARACQGVSVGKFFDNVPAASATGENDDKNNDNQNDDADRDASFGQFAAFPRVTAADFAVAVAEVAPAIRLFKESATTAILEEIILSQTHEKVLIEKLCGAAVHHLTFAFRRDERASVAIGSSSTQSACCSSSSDGADREGRGKEGNQEEEEAGGKSGRHDGW